MVDDDFRRYAFYRRLPSKELETIGWTESLPVAERLAGLRNKNVVVVSRSTGNRIFPRGPVAKEISQVLAGLSEARLG